MDPNHRRDQNFQHKKKQHNSSQAHAPASAQPKKVKNSPFEQSNSLKLPFVVAMLLLSFLATTDSYSATGGAPSYAQSIPFASAPHTARNPFTEFFDRFLHSIGLQTCNSSDSIGACVSNALFAVLRAKNEEEEKDSKALDLCYSDDCSALTDVQKHNQKCRQTMLDVKNSPDYCAVTLMYEVTKKSSDGNANSSSASVPLYQVSVPCDARAPLFQLFAPLAVTRSAATTNELAHPLSLPPSSTDDLPPFHFGGYDNGEEASGVKSEKQRVSIVASLKGKTVQLDSYILVPIDGICEEDSAASKGQKKCASELSVSPHEMEALLSILNQMKSEDLANLSKEFYASWTESMGSKAPPTTNYRALTFSAHLSTLIKAMQFVSSGAASFPLLTAPSSHPIPAEGANLSFDGPFEATGTTATGKKVRIHFIATECMPVSASSKPRAYSNGSATASAHSTSVSFSASAAPTVVPKQMPRIPDAVLARQVPLGTNVPPASTRVFMGQTPKKNVEASILSWLSFVAPSLAVLRVQPITKAQNPDSCTGTCNVYFEDEHHARASWELHKRSYYDAITVPSTSSGAVGAKGWSSYITYLGFWVLTDVSQYKPNAMSEADKLEQQTVFVALKNLRQKDPQRSHCRDWVCLHEMNVEEAKNEERSRSGVMTNTNKPVMRPTQQVSGRNHPPHTNNNNPPFAATPKISQQTYFENNNPTPSSAIIMDNFNNRNDEAFASSSSPSYCTGNANFVYQQYGQFEHQQHYNYHNHYYTQPYPDQGVEDKPKMPFKVDVSGPFIHATVVSEDGKVQRYRNNPYGGLLPSSNDLSKNSPSPSAITTNTPAITTSSVSTAPNTPSTTLLEKPILPGADATTIQTKSVQSLSHLHRPNDSPTAASSSMATQQLTDHELDEGSSGNILEESAMELDVLSMNATDGGETYNHTGGLPSRQHSSFIFAISDSNTYPIHSRLRLPQGLASGSATDPFVASRQVSTVAVYGDGGMPSLATF